MPEQSVLAVITARGGSKRIPKKNIKAFCGKPILSYSIEAALQSNIFTEVMVSTDSSEIAEVAKEYGASVPFMRSAVTSNDYAVTADVLREVLWQYDKLGQHFDYVCCLYPTAPFVTSEKLRDAFSHLINSEAESLNPVVAFSFPPQRGQVIDENGFLKYQCPENYPKRSQDLQPMYHDVGQFYFYKTDALLNKPRLEWKEIPYILDETEVQDIDNETDWELAEIKYKFMMEKLK